MSEENTDKRTIATEKTRDPNISTENQPKGSARRPSDTLDRPDPDNRGHRARDGSGVVEGSGASAGGGGNLARDVGSRDEERTATGGAPEPTRVTKRDKVQPDTGTQADNEGAQTSKN